MKKKTALLLLSALLLVGCNENSNEGNKTPETNQNQQNTNENNPTGGTETGGGNETGGNQEGGNETGGNETGGNQEGGGSQTGGNVEGNTYTATISTFGTSFEQAINDRVQFDNSRYANNVSLLKNYFGNYLEKEGCLTTLTFAGYVQSFKFDEGQYLCLGSSSSDGEMTWNSSLNIIKVEVTVLNYYKTYSYVSGGNPVTGVSCDNLAHFKLDDTDHSLEMEEITVPEPHTFSATYEGVKSFKISSVSGRVLVKSIAITWKE